MRLTALAASAALATAPALTWGGEDPAGVTPSFAWPPGLRANVEVRQVSDKTGQPHVDMTTRCKLNRQAHAKGLLVSCRDASISPEYSGEFAVVSDFLRLAAEFDWLVTAQGEFVGLANTDRMMAAMWKLPGPAKLSPEERKRVGDLSLAAGEADARTTWAMLVESWAGAPLTIGAEVSAPTDLEHPFVPGVPVRGRETAGADRWLDCPGQTRYRCIEIHAHTVVEPADFAVALDRFFQKHASKPLGERIQQATFSRSFVLVTDPATLVPYRLTVKTATSATLGDEKNLSQATEKTWTFTYPSRKELPPEGPTRR